MQVKSTTLPMHSIKTIASTVVLAATIFFLIAAGAHAQIIPAQNQVITAPYGQGYVVSTSTSPTHKLGTSLIDLAGSFVTGVLGINRGGTGTSTAPSLGQILVGNSVGGFDYVASSTFGGAITGTQGQNVIIGATGSAVATSSIFTTTGSLIGIGTTTPQERLSVLGDVVASDPIPYFRLDETDTTTDWYMGANSNRFFLANGLLATNQFLEVFNTGNVVIGKNGGNFGVGTSSPLQTLSVQGTGSIDPVLIASSTGATLFRVNTTGGVQLSNLTTASLFTTSGTYLSTSATGGMNIGATSNGSARYPQIDFYTNSGYRASFTNTGLGLGTTSPYAQLSVGGGNLVLGAATAGGTPGDLFLPKLATPAGAPLAVDPTGKVIATTTPSSSTPPGGLNLQVQYNNGGVFGGISGAVTDGTILNLTNPLLGGATLTTSSVNGVTLTTGGSATSFLNAAGTYTTPSGGGSGSSPFSTTTSTVSGQNLIYSNNNTDLLAIGSSSTTTAPVFFDPNKLINYFKGFVGIGTTSPDSPLTVNALGTTPVNGVIHAKGVSTGSEFMLLNPAANDWRVAFGSTLALWSKNAATNLAVGYNYAVISIGEIAGTTVIGGTSGSSKLTVNGNTSIGASYTGTAAPTNGLIVQGNVGIGTTTPSSRLTLSSSSVVPMTIDNTGGSHSLINFTSNGVSQGGFGYTTLGSGGLGFWNTALSNVNMIVTAAGNVGIGTTTPGSLLSLSGISNFTTATSTFYSTGGINLTGGGCFAINGVCVGGSTTAPGGSNTQIQYNNSGAFGGVSGMTTNGTNTTFAGGSLILAGASTGTASVQYASTALSGGTFNFPGINSTQTVAVLGLAQTFSADTTFSSINGNFGSSNVSSTYQLGYGATISGQTKTLNIGTGGVSGSATSINIGSAFGTTITFNNLGSGLLKATSGVLGLAASGTDYQAPITLTTTGSSGAATFVGNTLNIPQYAGTTYTATYPVTLTGSAFGLAFGTTTANTWNALNTFNGGLTIGSLTGTINANNGVVYSTATSSLSVGSPLTVTGTLGSLIGGTNSTINCQAASGSQAGCLSSTDWTTFNGKQAAGNYITALTGDGTASGPGSAAFTLATVNANVGTFNTLTVNAKGLVTAASNTSYENPLTFNYPLTRSTNTISLAFGTTTSNTWAGTQTFTNAPVLTSLATPAGSLLAVNAAGTIIATTSPSGGYSPIGTTGQFPYFSASNTLTATSSIFMAASGNVGIGSTTPTALLTAGYGYQPSQFMIASTSVWTGPGAYSYTAPTGTAFVTTTLSGAGGATDTGTGGSGAKISSTTVYMKGGDTGTIYVGQGGNINTPAGAFGYGLGGGGGSNTRNGGGSSAFTASSTGQAIIACAGAGGGDGNNGGNATGSMGGTGTNGSTFGGGGGGCGTNGGNASGATGGAGGTGGTPLSSLAGNGGSAGANGGSGSLLITAYTVPAGATGAQLIAGLMTVNPASITIGTTTSAGTVTIQGQSGSPAMALYGITGGSTQTLNQIINSINYAVQTIDQFGHLVTSGPVPSVTSCGTTPTMAAGSNDRNGHINTSGTVLTCTVTFAKAYSNAPQCTVGTGITSTQSVNTTVTGFVAAFGSSQSTSGINYVCQAYQ